MRVDDEVFMGNITIFGDSEEGKFCVIAKLSSPNSKWEENDGTVKIKINTNSYKKDISNIKYVNKRVKATEGQIQYRMATSFYYFFVKNKRIPTLDEFIEIQNNNTRLSHPVEYEASRNDAMEFNKRYANAYPSFIREFYVLLSVHEFGHYFRVEYDLDRDINGKADLTVYPTKMDYMNTIQGNDCGYKFAIFGNTKEAKKWRNYKEEYRNSNAHTDGEIILSVPPDFNFNSDRIWIDDDYNKFIRIIDCAIEAKNKP